jgi:hypothetical protein
MLQPMRGGIYCSLCAEEFTADDPYGPRVRDHDHVTCTFLGATHRQCNQAVQSAIAGHQTPKNALFFHNRNYDIRLILHGLRVLVEQNPGMVYPNVSLLPENSEKYMAATIGIFRFTDTFRFPTSSLETLISTLTPEQKTNMTQSPTIGQVHTHLLEGCVLNDRLDSLDKLEPGVPKPRDAFYSILT